MSKPDTSTLRRLLTEAFNEEDFDFFCYDYFKDVYREFAPKMSIWAKIQALIEYVEGNDQFDRLLALVKEANPAKYEDIYTSAAEAPVSSDEESGTVTIQSQTEVNTPPPVAGQNDVFISYSRRDLEFVARLYGFLTGQGLSVWFDQERIELGDQWRETIVEGIIKCKVFVLVLSPDSAASNNVRKEIDLAEHHEKQILPLMWRQTEFPPSIQYQLSGTQYLDFQQNASDENFEKTAALITKIVGGQTLAETIFNEPMIEAQGAPKKEIRPIRQTTGRSGRGRDRRGRGTPQQVSVVGTGIGVMTKVVTQITNFSTDEQDAINTELKWLFNAADHFLKIRRDEMARSEPVPVTIPEEAELTAEGANNAVISTLDDFSLQMIDGQIQSIIKQINIYMRNLAIELDKQAQMGGTAASNLALINSIKLQQKSIAERTQELAKLMEQVYGIMVYGPEDIVKQLL